MFTVDTLKMWLPHDYTSKWVRTKKIFYVYSIIVKRLYPGNNQP